MAGKSGAELPQSFGRFRVLRPLGRGGMGMVYLAEDPIIGRQVAIKVVRAEAGLDEAEIHELQTRFEREFQSAGTLSHPNIVTVFDVGKEGDASFFAMEFLPGESLGDVLRSDRVLSFKEIADYAMKICSALDYAHDHGVVHRDIKPANILIDRSGEPKITDFGVAKLTSTNLTRTGTVVGTPSYMSPEQVTGQPVSGASDQFSVAVILYQMLTGELPFTGENPTTILYKIVHETPVRPHEKKRTLPPQIDLVLLRALEKKAENRYARCVDLASAVREALGVAAQELDLAFDLPESTLQMRHQRGRPRKTERKLGALLAGGAAALAAVGLAFFLFATDAGKRVLGGGEQVPQSLARAVFVQAANSGASIWKDGTNTGLVVPAEVTIEGTEGDAVLLELRRDDRVVASKRLVIAPAMATEWVATEEAIPAQSYAVTTRPAGARVFLDDELVAETTPADVSLVPGERYDLRVELAEHHPESLTFAFPGDLDKSVVESGRFSFNLRPVIPPGHLVMAASYPVKVEVGGRSYGPSASHDISLKPGTYEVVLSSAEVFLAEKRQVEVASNGRVELPVPAAVKVRVFAQPGNCKVSINGREIDETPFDKQLVPGRYEFRFQWPALQQTRTLTEDVTASTSEVFGTPETR
ncbi:MAG TPA: serine/threonine-protein kinase [Thermoanaerobaculia bacterium]|nr:serine/threonine-protein kinase [Thermoanaerobaculia bacterium]